MLDDDKYNHIYCSMAGRTLHWPISTDNIIVSFLGATTGEL